MCQDHWFYAPIQHSLLLHHLLRFIFPINAHLMIKYYYIYIKIAVDWFCGLIWIFVFECAMPINRKSKHLGDVLIFVLHFTQLQTDAHQAHAEIDRKSKGKAPFTCFLLYIFFLHVRNSNTELTRIKGEERKKTTTNWIQDMKKFCVFVTNRIHLCGRSIGHEVFELFTRRECNHVWQHRSRCSVCRSRHSRALLHDHYIVTM